MKTTLIALTLFLFTCLPLWATNYTLTVIPGAGGTVNDSQGGIVSCTSTSGTCTATYASGTSDTLTASFSSPNFFVGWNGCSGGISCTITLSSNKTVTATFATFGAYRGVALVTQPTAPNFGNATKNGAIWQDSSYPSGTPPNVARCTDITISPSNPYHSMSAGEQGSGDVAGLFNANDTLIALNNSSGSKWITLFNPTTMVCGDPITGHVITDDKDLSNPGSSATSFSFGNGQFDFTNPSLWYGTSGTGVIPYTINTSNGQFTVGNTLLDFQYGLPYGASNVSAWRPTTSYNAGSYVTYTLTTAQAPDWQASTAYSTIGTIIWPLLNNPENCAFRLVTSGTSSSSEPTWSSATFGRCNSASNQVYSDGTAGWRNLGGPPTFTFQLTSSGGTSGALTPAFVPTGTNRPDLMTQISDNGLTWTNTGPNQVSAPWTDFTGPSDDGTRFCEGLSTDSYGYNGTGENADQGTGIYMVCYSTTLNQYFLLNTGTGWVSSTTCSGGTGYNCSGGTLTLNPVGAATQLAGNCGFLIHNDKQSLTNDYPVIASQSNMSATGTSCTYTSNAYDWAPFLSFNSTTSLQAYSAPTNHWAMGYSTYVNIGQNTATGYSTGIYDEVLSATNPTVPSAVSWQPPCASSWVPGGALPPCEFALAYDSHLSFAYNPLASDTTPVCGSVYNLATLASIPPVAPWQDEFVCVPTWPTWAIGGTATGQNSLWRFTHEYCSGANAFFDAQFCISHLSNDGKFAAFTTDMWNPATQTCGFGNNSTGSNTSLCGTPWVPSQSYTVGNMVNPYSATSGSGTSYGVYEVTTAGTSAATRPSWFVCSSGTAGNTVTDSNGVVYTCQGSNNARSDVLIVNIGVQTSSPTAPFDSLLGGGISGGSIQ